MTGTGTTWERRLYLAAHPLTYPLLRALARGGDVVRVPALGVVVNDADVARSVLLDGGAFRKDGPGSPADLWTPILGPSVLLNMEGEAHRELRAALAGLFTPGFADDLAARVLADPLRRMARRLADGETVDLADVTRVVAGTVIAHVIGLDATDETVVRRLFADGEEIVGMVRLGRRRLTDRQAARARAVLAPLGDIAAAAYETGDERTVMGRMRHLGLTADQARGAAGAFFLTGTETIATLVPRLVALLHDTGTLDRVAADPAALDTAIDEAMRVTTPTPMMLRSVHRPARIGHASVRAGDRVLIATHNCCRAYGRFDLDRPVPPLHRLWAGAGPHFCLGYPLALAEIRAVMRVLLTAGPLRIVRRRAARGVLIPSYRIFDIAVVAP